MKKASSGWMYSILLVAGIMCGGLSFAEGEAEAPKPNIWEEALIHPLDGMVLTDQRIDQFLARLSKSNPDRAGELEKMRITNPQQFRWEIREEITNRFFQSVIPTPPAEGESKTATPPSPPAGGSGQSAEEVQKTHHDLIVWLEKNFPQHADEMKANPAPSTERIEELIKRYDPIIRAEKSNPPLAEAMKEDIKNQMQCDEILMDIPYADEKGREALIKSLNDLLSKRFDLIVRKRELQYEQLYRRLERLQQELNKQKEEIDKLKGAKEETVNERVKVLMDRADKADWN